MEENSAVRELREGREADERRDKFDEVIKESAEHIRGLVDKEHLRAWRIIEILIQHRMNVMENERGRDDLHFVDDKYIREKLMEIEPR
jgi:hypothetical protein